MGNMNFWKGREDMNKVVPINRKRKRVLGAYINAHNAEGISEDIIFFIGVFFSTVLPQIIFSAYGGAIPLIVFGCIAVGGTLWGLAMRRRTPAWDASCFIAPALPQPVPDEDTIRKNDAA